MAAAQEKNAALVQPGERLRLLRDEANLDHIQTDAKSMTVLPDLSGPDFFFYDISWVDFCSGRPNHDEIAQHTGQEVSDLYSLQRVMEPTTALCAGRSAAATRPLKPSTSICVTARSSTKPPGSASATGAGPGAWNCALSMICP